VLAEGHWARISSYKYAERIITVQFGGDDPISFTGDDPDDLNAKIVKVMCALLGDADRRGIRLPDRGSSSALSVWSTSEAFCFEKGMERVDALDQALADFVGDLDDEFAIDKKWAGWEAVAEALMRALRCRSSCLV
jgi:hypothetical protein